MLERSEYYLVNRRQMEIHTGRASLLTAIAMGLLHFFPDDAKIAPETHIAIPSALFDIARSVCRNNGGYKNVVIERSSDKFTFVCVDGMTLSDTIVRVK
jgi:hypothetical protein